VGRSSCLNARLPRDQDGERLAAVDGTTLTGIRQLDPRVPLLRLLYFYLYARLLSGAIASTQRSRHSVLDSFASAAALERREDERNDTFEQRRARVPLERQDKSRDPQVGGSAVGSRVVSDH
jgi:hypothetical protein